MFEAFTKGFLETASELTKKELDMLPMGALTMTVEVGIRFLKDYLDGDLYFRTEKPEHNLIRARNQFKLAQSIDSQMISMGKYVRRLMRSYNKK